DRNRHVRVVRICQHLVHSNPDRRYRWDRANPTRRHRLTRRKGCHRRRARLLDDRSNRWRTRRISRSSGVEANPVANPGRDRIGLSTTQQIRWLPTRLYRSLHGQRVQDRVHALDQPDRLWDALLGQVQLHPDRAFHSRLSQAVRKDQWNVRTDLNGLPRLPKVTRDRPVPLELVLLHEIVYIRPRPRLDLRHYHKFEQSIYDFRF